MNERVQRGHCLILNTQEYRGRFTGESPIPNVLELKPAGGDELPGQCLIPEITPKSGIDEQLL